MWHVDFRALSNAETKPLSASPSTEASAQFIIISGVLFHSLPVRTKHELKKVTLLAVGMNTFSEWPIQ